MDIGDIKYLEVKEVPKVLKFSEAMRLGCLFTKETQDYRGCALGAAYFASAGKDLQKEAFDQLFSGQGFNPAKICADHFGVSEMTAIRVSSFHHRGDKTREQCADWLESEGY